MPRLFPLLLLASSALAAGGPDTWMQDTLSTIGPRSLKAVCVPGSHDAGMSEFNWHTPFATRGNTITQTNSVLGQLGLGARFFDVRPFRRAGDSLHVGHYSNVALGQWVGADGQSIADIVANINEFTQKSNELVIVKISHASSEASSRLQADGSLQISYRDYNQTEYEELMAILDGINDKWVASADTDIASVPLNDFIGGGKAAVVVLMPVYDLGNYGGKGFFRMPYQFDQYSETDSVDKMTADQIDKMKANCDSEWMLLSWTLTESAVDIVEMKSIIEFADQANAVLSERLVPEVKGRCIPNVLHIDNIMTPIATNLCMQFNKQYQ